MAVLKHPNLDWDNAVAAPHSITESVSPASIVVLILEQAAALPHPSPVELLEAGGEAVGYAS